MPRYRKGGCGLRGSAEADALAAHLTMRCGILSSSIHRSVDQLCSFFSQTETKYITSNSGAIHMDDLLIANGLLLYPDTIRTQGTYSDNVLHHLNAATFVLWKRLW